ncbi:uncharacterized protein [Leptinotarsa decemlineata]|uniref:uncharacterized protein n=1 Tax=Leptinotarsa decemlineata TaxID=7539 RepID=UPI003D30CA4E
MATTKIKIDPNRLTKEELLYELIVRGLDGTNLVVTELRAVLRNALRLEKTSLAIKNPIYPYAFSEDSQSLKSNLDTIELAINEFEGTEQDGKYKSITSKIAHSLGRLNRAHPESEVEKKCISDIRLKLLLAFDKLQEKSKKFRKGRDSTVFDLSVIRGTVGDPGAQSSTVDLDGDSSEEDDIITRIKPVPVRDWGLRFTGKKGDMSLSTFLEKVDERRRSRGISRAVLFRDAVDLFEGDAYIWFNMVKDWATDWESLVDLMREQFLPDNFDRDLFEEIKRRTQGTNENIGLYIASMKGLFKKMRNPISEESQLEIILERIDPYYHPFLAFGNITSIADLLESCRKLDAKRQLAKSYTPPPHKNRSLIPELAYASTSEHHSSPAESTMRRYESTKRGVNSIESTDVSRTDGKRCWNCRELGHLSTTCRQQQKRYCYKCGYQNVTVRNCPRCNKLQGNDQSRR